MVMGIDKIVMILYQYTFIFKGGMMMYIVADVNTEFLFQESVRLLRFSIKENIDITKTPMTWHRIIFTKSNAFQKHHRYPVLPIKTRQLGNDLPLMKIFPFYFIRNDCKFQQRIRRQSSILRQFPDRII